MEMAREDVEALKVAPILHLRKRVTVASESPDLLGVLLTGVTGLLGGAILRSLLLHGVTPSFPSTPTPPSNMLKALHKKGKFMRCRVFCVVRAQEGKSSWNRLREALHWWTDMTEDCWQRIHVSSTPPLPYHRILLIAVLGNRC